MRCLAPYAVPQVGDLVLRRRFNVDKSLGMKLYTKWDGPYRLIRIAKSGVSGDIQDLKTGRVIGRYAFESLKVFIPPEGGEYDRELGRRTSLAEGLRNEPVVGGMAVTL